MKKILYSITWITIVAILCIYILPEGDLHPADFMVMGIAIAPFIYILLLIKLVTNDLALKTVLYVTLPVSISSIAAYLDLIFFQIGTISGFIFTYLPTWQGVFLAVITIPLYLLNRSKKT